MHKLKVMGESTDYDINVGICSDLQASTNSLLMFYDLYDVYNHYMILWYWIRYKHMRNHLIYKWL